MSAREARRAEAAEVAALLLELHGEAGNDAVPRAAVMDRWAEVYPAPRDRDKARRGLSLLERSAAVRRSDDEVELVDVAALTAIADGHMQVRGAQTPRKVKRAARERMASTGEPYSVALRHVQAEIGSDGSP